MKLATLLISILALTAYAIPAHTPVPSLNVPVVHTDVEKLNTERGYFQNLCIHLAEEVAARDAEIESMRRVVESSLRNGVRKVTVTAYTLSPDECGPSMKPYMEDDAAIPGFTAGVSRDLKHWMGKEIYVEGFGIRRVNDLMAASKRGQIDLLVHTKKEAFNTVGKRRQVSVILLDD